MRLKMAQGQYDEQSKVTDTLQKDILELKKFKSAFESATDGEEANYRLIRDNCDLQSQATLFYEALLMKKAQVIKLVKELKGKENELGDSGKKHARTELLVQKLQDKLETSQLELQRRKEQIELYRKKGKDIPVGNTR